MGFRFRQRIKLLPGVHVNVTGKGLSSVSIGGPGATLNVGKGMRITGTAGLPGSGISYRQVLHPGGRRRTVASFRPTDMLRLPATDEEASASVPRLQRRHPASWSSPALKNIEQHIVESQSQRLELEGGITELNFREDSLLREVKRLSRWYQRWFRREALEAAKAELAGVQAELADAAALLDEQGSDLEWSLPPSLRRRYDEFTSAISALESTPAAWHVRGTSQIDRVQERTAFGSVLDRVATEWGFGWPSFVPRGRADFYDSVPCLRSADGVSLYFLPTFVVVERESSFGLVSLTDITFELDEGEVVEHQHIPGGTVSRYTWRYVNKDGTPDQRFNENPRIPVVAYTYLTITVRNAFSEMFHFAVSPQNIFTPWFSLTDWFEQAAKRRAMDPLPLSSVTWALREEDDGSYLAASLDGKEVIAFALLTTEELWVGLSGEALHANFSAGKILSSSPTMLSLWFGEEPVDVGSFSGHDCRVTPSHAAFKILPPPKIGAAEYLLDELEAADDIFISIAVNGEVVSRLRLPTQGAREHLIAKKAQVASRAPTQGTY